MRAHASTIEEQIKTQVELTMRACANFKEHAERTVAALRSVGRDPKSAVIELEFCKTWNADKFPTVVLSQDDADVLSIDLIPGIDRETVPPTRSSLLIIWAADGFLKYSTCPEAPGSVLSQTPVPLLDDRQRAHLIANINYLLDHPREVVIKGPRLYVPRSHAGKRRGFQKLGEDVPTFRLNNVRDHLRIVREAEKAKAEEEERQKVVQELKPEYLVPIYEHVRRAHTRRYKSGKFVQVASVRVRAHTRGNKNAPLLITPKRVEPTA